MNLGHPAVNWPLRTLIVATQIILLVPFCPIALLYTILDMAENRLNQADLDLKARAFTRRAMKAYNATKNDAPRIQT